MHQGIGAPLYLAVECENDVVTELQLPERLGRLPVNWPVRLPCEVGVKLFLQVSLSEHTAPVPDDLIKLWSVRILSALPPRLFVEGALCQHISVPVKKAPPKDGFVLQGAAIYNRDGKTIKVYLLPLDVEKGEALPDPGHGPVTLDGSFQGILIRDNLSVFNLKDLLIYQPVHELDKLPVGIAGIKIVFPVPDHPLEQEIKGQYD